MPAYHDSDDELGRKYNNTFIKYAGNYVYCKGFIEEDKDCKILIYDEKGTRKELFETDKLEEIHFDSCIFNVLGSKLNVYDCDNGTILGTTLWRLPRRQWKRSFCGENSNLSCPVKSFYERRGLPVFGFHHEIGFQVLKSLVAQTYPPLQKAYEMLPKHICVAVSPMFCLALSTISSRKALIGSMSGFVGEYDPDGMLLIQHEPAAQEVKDFLYRTHQYARVEVCPLTKIPT